MKNLQWTDLELLDRGIESYPELVITDEIMMDMLPNGSLTGIGVKQKEEVGNYSPEVVVGWAQQPTVYGQPSAKKPFLLERNYNMFICPTCRSAFATEEILTKHFLKCWREHNPNHKPKPAPCKGNTTQREMNEDVANFFARLKGE